MAKSVIINGVTYPDVPEVKIPLANETGNATFYETSGNDVADGDVKQGKKYTGASGPSTGTMPLYESGADSGTISTKNGTVPIAAGWHDGSGSVGIHPDEIAKIIEGNIRAGVTLLGQPGKATVVDTAIQSGGAGSAQILTGYSAWVNGSLVPGSLTAATVSQDASTKVLSIS